MANLESNAAFWTTCCYCKLNIQYSRSYLGLNLRCPICRIPFIANEIPAPPVHNSANQNVTSGSSEASRRDSLLSTQSLLEHQRRNFLKEKEKEKCSDVPEVSKRKRPASRWEFKKIEKSASIEIDQIQTENSNASEESRTGQRKAESSRLTVTEDKKLCNFDASAMLNRPVWVEKTNSGLKFYEKKPISDGSETSRRLILMTAKDIFSAGKRHYMKVAGTEVDFRKLLLKKARKAIPEKLKDQNFVTETSQEAFRNQNFVIETPKSSDKEANLKEKTEGILGLDKKKPGQEEEEEEEEKEEVHGALTLSVPDPDFYDFDKDRTEMAFRPNQVWASYDDKDGMPRFYAMIHEVVSRKPFIVSISWLKSRSTKELGSDNWISSGFYKTIGNFHIRKRVLSNSVNSFSHIVKYWTKGPLGLVKIFPKKGDVWAVYKNWSADWDAFMPFEVVNRYDTVLVIDDLEENRGVAVRPLIKVSGFKTVFRPHPNPNTIRMFPKNELFRFSHQVASHPLTGKEGPNAPKGCFDLDPAAMSAELLQVLNAEQVREMEDLVEKTMEKTERKLEKVGEKGFAEGTNNGDEEDGTKNSRE